MGWRESYATLLELFPQVDARLIRGAALEHGNDVAAAAEFILNDVLDSDEGNSDNEQLPDTATHHGAANSSEDLEPRNASAGEEQAVIATDFGTTLDDSRQDEQVVVSVSSSEALRNSESHSGSVVFHITAEPEAQELTGESSNDSRVEPPATTEMGEGVEVEVADSVAGGSVGVPMEPVEEDELGLANIVRQIFLLSRRSKDVLASPSDIRPPLLSAYQEFIKRKEVKDVKGGMRVESESLADLFVSSKVMEEDKSEVENSQEKSQVALCDPSTSSTSLTLANSVVSEDHGPGEAVHVDLVHDESLPEFPTQESGPPSALEGGQGLESVFDQYSSQMQEHREYILDLKEAEALERVGSGEEYSTKNFTADGFPVYDDSISVPRPAYEEDEVALDDGLDSMMSIQKSAISEEMDRADWENVNCISIIHTNQMEPLDLLVEEAKADKEALISSIEEIRLLRLMTDQAEYAARQSREEAVRGGVDVMAKVDEMRKMLSRARDANAVHAGEVFGEKAVLATEARELQYRLAQVNSEKAKAVTALNEIKASLQARIESANLEREAAEREKVEKELHAKDALAKEEALVAKVAQESRDLDAEAETCTKIREFLIERGSIVDALQGEVAVLREDAESLKKDLESMSLSYSGFHVNVLSHAGSDTFNSIGSRSGKVSELYGQPSGSAVPVESGAIFSRSNSGSVSLRSASGLPKTTTDRKSWSSLPSLLRGLSGSQDLNGSSHSGYSSHASNSLSASRDALDVNQAERSQLLGSENSVTDIQNTSSPHSPMSQKELLDGQIFAGEEDIQNPSPNSPTSPEAKKQEEQELLRWQMFPGEELEMEHSSGHNLDVFRIGSRADTDEEDWQMLEKGSSRSSSRSSTDK